jgi:hypothetical protein
MSVWERSLNYVSKTEENRSVATFPRNGWAVSLFLEGLVSIRIMSAVWEEADVSGAKLLVLLALADYANDEGFCWPGVHALAKKARVSERYVRELLGDLERDDYIIRELNTGPYGVNTYKVLVGDANLAGVRTDTLGGYDN